MRVVIAGAGVSGLALARGLQGTNHDVTVLEEAPQLRTGGAAISVWNNGAMALKRLGVTLESHGRVIDRLEMRSRKGYLAAVVDARRLSRSLGIEAVTVGRGELLEHLASQLQPGTIRFDTSCVGVDDSGETPRVQVNGGLWISADLVVGADGQRSVVRSLFASPRTPTPTGWASLQGLTAAPLRVSQGTTSVFVVGKEGGVGLMPAGRGFLQWWFDVPWPQPQPPSSVLGWLRRRFEGWGSPVRELLEVVSAPEIEVFPHVWHHIPRHIVSERVALIGDSVHAVPPVFAQGANQSFEDAWVLTRELNAAISPVRALRRYEKERRRKVAVASRSARLPMLPIYGKVAICRARGPLLPTWFCTLAWRANMCACSSTLPFAGRQVS